VSFPSIPMVGVAPLFRLAVRRVRTDVAPLFRLAGEGFELATFLWERISRMT